MINEVISFYSVVNGEVIFYRVGEVMLKSSVFYGNIVIDVIEQANFFLCREIEIFCSVVCKIFYLDGLFIC